MSEPRQRPDVGSYEDICAAASRTTGLTDFGGTDHEEGLRLLVDDLASPEAGLTPVGNYFHRSQVKSALVGRLMTEARFAEFPEHRDVRIERPIFVLGLPRTGTTALHRLLCADPGHQGLELWLTEFPHPRPRHPEGEIIRVRSSMQKPEFLRSYRNCWNGTSKYSDFLTDYGDEDVSDSESSDEESEGEVSEHLATPLFVCHPHDGYYHLRRRKRKFRDGTNVE